MPALFEPITLRGLTVKNRVWLAPMCQYMVEKCDGVPTDWHLVHLGARAQGGFGLIIAEATAVRADGRISPQDTGLWTDAQRDAWARIVQFVHSQDAAIGVQLAHAGRKASTYRGFAGERTGSVSESEGGWPTVSPTSEAFPGLHEPRAMDREDMPAIVSAFKDAARRADEAGFDTVEIHAAHGYLLHEFLSPLTNTRTDEYGGGFDGRARLLLEVVDAVRQIWPAEKPLLVRLSATDWNEHGWTGDDTTRLSGVLRDHGVDLIDVSTGGNILADIPVGPGYQLPFARQVREQAQVLTGAVGLIVSPHQAEEVLVEGDADVVLLGRVALREPSWPLRAAYELGLTWRESPWPKPYSPGRWDGVPAWTPKLPRFQSSAMGRP